MKSSISYCEHILAEAEYLTMTSAGTSPANFLADEIAVAITSQAQRAGFPLTMELASPGLPKQSWVKISQIRTLSNERIGKKIAQASPEELVQVIEGLNEIVG